MSVPKSKRAESKLEVITAARDLAEYTVRTCSNEKYFPKRYRWCMTSKIVDASNDILKYIAMANSVYAETKELAAERMKYQAAALAHTEALLQFVDLGYRVFGIEARKIEYWTGLIIKLRTLLRGWRKSDKERFKF